MIDGRNFFDQPVQNYLKTYDNIRRTSTGQGDDYTTDCLLCYIYFKEHYKMITIDLSKQKNQMLIKSNTANHFYLKPRLRWKYNNIFHC